MSTSNIRINNRVASTLEVGNSLVDRAYYGSSPVFSLSDPDADAYIALVESADDDDLDVGVKVAITNFVVSCKSDGIWDAIKASCILAGARTLNGALVPLKGDAPTNFNFVSDDYDRVMGLKGDGSTKYLDSNRANDADPQDSNHNEVFLSSFVPSSGVFMSSTSSPSGETGSNELINPSDAPFRVRFRSSDIRDSELDFSGGMLGASRENETEVIMSVSGVNEVKNLDSQAPNGETVNIFARKNASFLTDARVQFYSIGEAVDLAALDARVTTLMTEIEGALT